MSSSSSSPQPVPQTPYRRTRPFTSHLTSHPLSPHTHPDVLATSFITAANGPSSMDPYSSPSSPNLQTPRTPPTCRPDHLISGVGARVVDYQFPSRRRKDSYGFGEYDGLPSREGSGDAGVRGSMALDMNLGVLISDFSSTSGSGSGPKSIDSEFSSTLFTTPHMPNRGQPSPSSPSPPELARQLPLIPALNLDLHSMLAPDFQIPPNEGVSSPDVLTLTTSESPLASLHFDKVPINSTFPGALPTSFPINSTSLAGPVFIASTDNPISGPLFSAHGAAYPASVSDSRRRSLKESLRKYFGHSVSSKSGRSGIDRFAEGNDGLASASNRDPKGRLKTVFTTRRSLRAPGSNIIPSPIGAMPGKTFLGDRSVNHYLDPLYDEELYSRSSSIDLTSLISRKFSVITQPSSSFDEFEQQFSFELQQQLWNDTDAVVLDTHKGKGKQKASPPKPKFQFDDLPREIKIAVLKCLLDGFREEDGFGKWQGDRGGRKELIRCSAVSREWQALCFDGQLWPSVDLTCLISELPVKTLLRVLHYTVPFVRSLSLRNMNSLSGIEIIDTLKINSPSDKNDNLCPKDKRFCLPNVRHLDLRGCSALNAQSLSQLLRACTNLVTLNLRGVKAVSTAVLFSLVSSGALIQDLTLPYFTTSFMTNALQVYLETISEAQASAMKHLRLPRMNLVHRDKILDLIAKRLINLETLDIRRWGELTDSDLNDFFDAAKKNPIQSSLKHLLLSDIRNRSLTHAPFMKLSQAFPNIRTLEMAGMSGVFQGSTGAAALCEVIKPLKWLERLDLDGTGSQGAVDDNFLLQLKRGAIVVGEEGHSGGGGGGSRLIELRIAHAKTITSDAVCKLIRACKSLRVLDLDQTNIGTSVVTAFYETKLNQPNSTLSVLDCKHILHLPPYDPTAPPLPARVRPRPEAILANAKVGSSRISFGGGGVSPRLFLPFGYDGSDWTFDRDGNVSHLGQCEESRWAKDKTVEVLSTTKSETETEPTMTTSTLSTTTPRDNTIINSFISTTTSTPNSASTSTSTFSTLTQNPNTSPITTSSGPTQFVVRHCEKWTFVSPPRPYLESLRAFDLAKSRGEADEEALRRVLIRPPGGKRGGGLGEFDASGCVIM